MGGKGWYGVDRGGAGQIDLTFGLGAVGEV